MIHGGQHYPARFNFVEEISARLADGHQRDCSWAQGLAAVLACPWAWALARCPHEKSFPVLRQDQRPPLDHGRPLGRSQAVGGTTQSTLLITLFEFATGTAMVLALWACTQQASPLAVVRQGLRNMVCLAPYRTPFLLILGLLGFDLVETRLDDALTAALGYDGTVWIHRWEGNLASGFQRAACLPLTCLLSFCYVVMFPVQIITPLVLLSARGEIRSYRALLKAVALNYAVCFPFYLFFPVKEMWAGNPEKVSLLINHLHPAIMEAYRSSSALDNCFPSFHTSLSATTALIVWRTCPRRLAVPITISAALVIFATLYLGIHWASDVLAGLGLAWLAARIALGASQHSHPPDRRDDRSAG
jgi:membrane-associated phospholipid phosphatase